MKKLILIVLAAFVTNIASAQFKIGVKGGVTTNLSNLNFKNFDINEDFFDATQDGKNIGFHLGLQLRVHTGLGLYFESDVLYNYAPASMNFTRDNKVTSLTVRRHGLDIPVLVGFKIAFFRVYLGPKFYVDLGETQKINSPDNIKINTDFNKDLFGYQAGIGFDILKKITIDVAYNGRLAKSNQKFTLTDNVGGTQEINSKLGSHQLMLTLGFLF